MFGGGGWTRTTDAADMSRGNRDETDCLLTEMFFEGNLWGQIEVLADT